MRLLSGTLSVLIASMIASAPASALQVIRIESREACSSCDLEVEKVATLGTRAGPGIIESDIATAVRDSRGRYYVMTSYGTDILVFDPTGDFVRRIGREGAGPGEFGGIGDIVIGPADSVFVFDNPNVRYSVFDPGHSHVRSVALEIPPYMEAELLPDGRMILASPVRTPERAGLPLHLMGRDGSAIRSFGSGTGVYRRDVPFMDERTIDATPGGAVWSAYRNQYVLEKWDTAGGRLLELRREAEWFPSRLRPRSPGSRTGDLPPQPRLQAISEKDGLLWVIVLVPGENWRDGTAPDRGTHDSRVVDFNLYYDTRLEIIDPVRGVLVRSVRLPQAMLGFAAPGFLTGTITDDLGVPYVGVWRVRLEYPTAR